MCVCVLNLTMGGEWGIKGGGGRHNIGGWVGVGAWGRGHAVPVELGGGDRRDATHAMPVERGGGGGVGG